VLKYLLVWFLIFELIFMWMDIEDLNFFFSCWSFLHFFLVTRAIFYPNLLIKQKYFDKIVRT
jgi:hypothetical protein